MFKFKFIILNGDLKMLDSFDSIPFSSFDTYDFPSPSVKIRSLLIKPVFKIVYVDGNWMLYDETEVSEDFQYTLHFVFVESFIHYHMDMIDNLETHYLKDYNFTDNLDVTYSDCFDECLVLALDFIGRDDNSKILKVISLDEELFIYDPKDEYLVDSITCRMLQNLEYCDEYHYYHKDIIDNLEYRLVLVSPENSATI